MKRYDKIKSNHYTLTQPCCLPHKPAVTAVSIVPARASDCLQIRLNEHTQSCETEDAHSRILRRLKETYHELSDLKQSAHRGHKELRKVCLFSLPLRICCDLYHPAPRLMTAFNLINSVEFSSVRYSLHWLQSIWIRKKKHTDACLDERGRDRNSCLKNLGDGEIGW